MDIKAESPKAKSFCRLTFVFFLVLAKINNLTEKSKFLLIYFSQTSIGATIGSAYATTIFLTFSTTYTQQYIFAPFLVFSKSKLGFPKKPKNIKPKLFPVFLGRISFFVYFCPRNEKKRGRIL